MAKGRGELDRELADLAPDLRWREWLRRIEAVLFASATPISREDLGRVVGQGASVDLLVGDLIVDLADRPYEVARVGSGWTLRTRPAYAAAIRVAADVAGQALALSDFDLAVMAAIACHQPSTRDALTDIFGRHISRDLIGCLFGQGLITTGPRAPRRGAPYTFVTTEAFRLAFGLATLSDWPTLSDWTDARLWVRRLLVPRPDRDCHQCQVSGVKSAMTQGLSAFAKSLARA